MTHYGIKELKPPLFIVRWQGPTEGLKVKPLVHDQQSSDGFSPRRMLSNDIFNFLVLITAIEHTIPFLLL